MKHTYKKITAIESISVETNTMVSYRKVFATPDEFLIMYNIVKNNR